VGDFAALAAAFRQGAAMLEQATPKVVSHGAVIIKRSLQSGIAGVVGGDMEMTEGGGGPVNVRYRIDGQGPVVTATLRPTGATVYWIDRGTQEHDIRPRRKNALAFGNRTDDNEVRSKPVRHPGGRARPFWRQRTTAAANEANRAMTDDLTKLIESVFT
jgi:hypothetical protein